MGLAADVFDQLVSCVFRCSGLLVHLRSLKATMNQKPSVVQIIKSVPQVLTSGIFAGAGKTDAVLAQVPDHPLGEMMIDLID